MLAVLLLVDGRRFLDGQTSDEELFKYLMDNALQSQQQSNLTVGISLIVEPVAILTHDIVWMETAEVLIARQDLHNVGT
ncbi:hypothetical protein [Pseudomonas sp. GM17]|uniref:hypothetical protein n=1 Tax=Pseudomonas sp. GM17 TaxID=1144323 RepID=UPI00027277B0|nr:hypothetical protein [Pseudomonas sp. GM17]WIE49861.1 hypothetical protein PMI20_029875 [Pseudomonas sp. GM17]